MEHEKRHYAVVDPFQRKLTIQKDGQVIAQSENALILKEVGRSVYDPVLYVPKADVVVDLVSEAKRQSHCPIKGDATYWNLGEKTSNYFAWSYENPHPKSGKIGGYVAFNPQYVSFLSEPLNLN